ncbi:MAG: class A beta-lactamase-related serine hydrolase [Chitinophagales bacterium]|nr:class A beta-lactamase-related serine hydrolase [Chitinophagales bacterium]
MKKISTLLLLLLHLTLPLAISVQAQVISVATQPSQAGFAADRLSRIDSSIGQWINQGWMQGGTALIIRNGKVVYHKGFGYSDLDSKTPMQKNDIFRIASQTKAITSVAIMMLFEEGKLLLDDPVSKFIPAYKNQQVLNTFNESDTTYTTVPAKREITIRQLLSHTSGLGYASIGSKEANAIYAKANLTAGLNVQDDDLLSAMNRLAKMPLMHQPGERWTYGLNTDLLGCLVEVISGKTLDAFFKERIFTPLGMKDTHFLIPAEKAKRLVAPDYPLIASTYYSGGAGLSSTIEDYGIFLQMLLNGGVYNGKRLLSRNSVRMMTSNQIGDVTYGGGNDKFGLGFAVVTDKSSGRTPANEGTFSWGGAFATSYWVDPKENMVYLFYRQLQNTTKGEMAEKFRTLVYQAIND